MSLLVCSYRDHIKQRHSGGLTSFFRRWISLLRTPGSSIAILLMLPLVGVLPALMSAMYVMLGTHMLIAAQGGTGSQEDVTYALGLLEQARDWTPSEPHVYRMLAQAYQLNNQPELAVAALERAYQLQPSSLLIQQELALAYKSVNKIDYAVQLWRRLDVTAAQMLVRGDEALDRQQYAAAMDWYNIAAQYDPDIESALPLRRFLVERLTGSPTAMMWFRKAQASDQSLVMYALSDTLKINGADLRWMLSIDGIYGVPISYGTGGNTTGYLWWTGQAFAVILVEQAGDYQISMHVLHDDPPPVEMAIGVNGQQIQQVLLGRGDNSWETVNTSVFFTAGIHIIQVSFLNDAILNGEDRNAVIEWIMVEHQSKCERSWINQ